MGIFILSSSSQTYCSKQIVQSQHLKCKMHTYIENRAVWKQTFKPSCLKLRRQQLSLLRKQCAYGYIPYILDGCQTAATDKMLSLCYSCPLEEEWYLALPNGRIVYIFNGLSRNTPWVQHAYASLAPISNKTLTEFWCASGIIRSSISTTSLF